MRRSLSFTPWVALAASLVVGAYAACADAEPSPGNSTIPAFINLVGHDGAGNPDTFGRFKCTIRDLANVPRPGVDVMIDFSSCPGMRVCTDQRQAGVTVQCSGAAAVHMLTGALGEVSMEIVGQSDVHAGSPSDYVRILADGVLQGTPGIAAFDLDGANGVGAGDLSMWLSDFASSVNWRRSDYDGSGSIGAGDLSVWLTVYGSGRSVGSCSSVPAATCP